MLLESIISTREDESVRYRENEGMFNKVCAEHAPTFDLGRLYVEWVEGKVTIKRGAMVVNSFTSFKWINMKTPKGYIHRRGYLWEDDLEKVADIPCTNIYFQKHKNAFYCKYLGCRPTKFISMFNSCMIKAFVPEHLRSVANEFCRFGSSRAYDETWVNSLVENKDVITTLISDNLCHLIPVVIGSYVRGVSNPTPENLKRVFGKSTWKSVANSTKSRNLLLTKAVLRGYSMRDVVNVPSSLLKAPRTAAKMGYESDVVSVLEKEKLLTKYETHSSITQVISDTKNMYLQLGLVLPKQAAHWSLAKWNENHDFCVKKVNMLKYSDEKFTCLNLLQNRTFVSECGEFTGEILDNALAIRTEGDSMHHCVGSYSDRCLLGRYMVVSIRNSTGCRSSTLGLTWSDENIVSRQQHYGHCNASVTNKKENEFAKYIVKNINKQLEGSNAKFY